MRDFEYEAPTTLSEAVELLARAQGAARPLAGGTDLIDHIRTGRLAPDIVVDIKRIPELNILELTPGGLRLGAAVPCSRIYGHQGLAVYAALVDACSIIGGIQIQSRASVGGNVCNSGAAADTTPALIALGASCKIAGPNGTRSVPVEEFCTGPATNVLQPGELLVEFEIPAPASHSGNHYRRFIPRNEMDIAVVGVGASLTLTPAGDRITAARVGLGAVGPRPILATAVVDHIVGKVPTPETFHEAGKVARTLISPIDDHRGTVEFRTHVTGVLVERVLATALERATAAK